MRKKQLSDDSDNERPNRSNEKIKTTLKDQTKATNKYIDGPRLDYAPINGKKQEDHKYKSQLKNQNGTMKKEIKVQTQQVRNELGKILNQNKKKIQKVPFPPPNRQIILSHKATSKKGAEQKDILTQSQDQAKLIIGRMKSVYKHDLRAFSSGELAYQKIKYLQVLNLKLQNTYVKRKFIELGGIKMFQKWLDKVVDQNDQEREPSLAIRIGIFKLLFSMSLKAEEIDKTKNIQLLIQRNRTSQVQQLREVCRQLLSNWDLTIIDKVSRQKGKQ